MSESQLGRGAETRSQKPLEIEWDSRVSNWLLAGMAVHLTVPGG